MDRPDDTGRHESTFPVMGTEAHVVILGGTGTHLEQARSRLQDLEARWSRFRSDSELSQLNRSPGVPLVVSAETHRVITQAIDAWWWTDGSFDPTIATTMRAAGYADPWPAPTTATPSMTDHRPSPTPASIRLDPYPGSITVPDGVELDLGGIGKGAAADLVAEEAVAAGAAGCCVNIGGDLRLAGRPPSPSGWRVEIESPWPDRPPVALLGVTRGAVCTSVITRRAWRGSRGDEHHVREPSTGAPLRTGLAGVTVVGATAVQAEVLTKTILAAGLAMAPALAARTGTTGVLVTDQGQRIDLPGLATFLDAGVDRSAA